MPRAAWVATMVWVAVGFAPPAGAQPLAPLAPTGGPPLGSTPVTPARSADRPPPVLGAPVGVGDFGPPQPVTPVGFRDTPPTRPPARAAAFGAPSAAGSAGGIVPDAPAAPVPAALVDAAVGRTAYQPPPSDPVNEFLARRSELKERDASPDGGSAAGGGRTANRSDHRSFGGWGEKFDGVFGARNGEWFRSDHMFDCFISPVTNPFLFEDPRSLTELRPIFIYQKVPSGQRDFLGGHVTYFGTQARVAFTDRWSLVLSKFGGISVNPADGSTFQDKTGFAEIWLGPKFTFYRGEETGSVAAAGLQFQIPVGSGGAFQITGALSLVPYVSYGQNFLRDFRYGSFNVLANTGLSFSTNNQRSDYYWLSGHLDFDVANLHRFYPLMELNWFLNTSNGRSLPIGSEGRDLINFGGAASGSGLLTAAFGGRVKITEAAQLGGAFEFPMAGRKDLFRYRFTLDFILRY
jgi:hypothetical protein